MLECTIAKRYGLILDEQAKHILPGNTCQDNVEVYYLI